MKFTEKHFTKIKLPRLCALCLSAAMIGSLAAAGCGGSDESVVVSSVAEVCGIGTMIDVYAGVVSARSELSIRQTPDKNIDEIKVAEGDAVSEGQVLFTYDAEKMQLDYDKASLELEQMKATKEAKEKELETLNKEKSKASENDKLRYTLEIQSCETEIREQDYNIGLKEKEVERLAASLDETEYRSPISGRVKSVNAEGGFDDYGNEKPFMELVESGAYKVKGFVNENNASSLMGASSVIIRSRIDESRIWRGFVESVDWENPQGSGSNYYYLASDSMETVNSSKYPFYVELEDSEGLILGQHVYIEPDLGQSGEVNGINLPAFYLIDAAEDSSSAFVWAEDSSGRLEKRAVSLGGYNAETDCYIVTEGLDAKDYIAFPDETTGSGMHCEHNGMADPDPVFTATMPESVGGMIG